MTQELEATDISSLDDLLAAEQPADDDTFEDEPALIEAPAPDASLDDLFAEAEQTIARNRRNAKPASNEAVRHAAIRTSKRMQELYTLPEFWEPTRCVALIYQPTQTLVGHYQEYFHKSVPGCRKLVRSADPLPVQGVEYVQDSWYLGEHAEAIQNAERWDFEKEVILADLDLPSLGVRAPAATVLVRLYFGGIMSVRLREHIRFASQDGTLLLTLPLDTNILEVMSHDSKIALRKELAQ